MTQAPSSFDDGLDRLEALVQQLEGGALGLEEALTRYEKEDVTVLVVGKIVLRG